MSSLPKEIVETLRKHPKGLVVPTRFADGHGVDAVTFYRAEEIPSVTLWVSMDNYIDNYDETESNTGLHYGIEAFDLLSRVPGYRAFGILVWLRTCNEFATCDDDHCVLRSFPSVTLQDVLQSPELYINAGWYPDRVENKLVRPWSDPLYDGVVAVEDPWS
jgi:hypothetical protein